jgi:ribose/xylose/arabinose/galactoside ABC-type transport system permease subunit
MIEDIEDAKRLMEELLVARIDDHHMSFYAKSRAVLGDLPKTNIMQRTYMLHGGMVGFFICAALGFLAGVLVVALPNPWFPEWYVPASPATIIAITTVIGAVAGAIWTALVSSALPNEMLDKFRQDIEKGHVLMTVSVPPERCEEIRDKINHQHPAAIYLGSWPKEHVVFP